MRKLLILAIFALFISTGITRDAFTASNVVIAKAVAKKAPVQAKKVVAKKKKVSRVCNYCKSLAEGVDKSTAAKAAQWQGLVIGMNDGEKSLVITEAPKMNRIKAYPQRSIRITDETKIITEEGWDGDFANLDIGYKVEVRGNYDAKKRIVSATSIEIIDVPSTPVTKTK